MKRVDRCPGLLRPHHAEDGDLVRLRVPGGQTTADALSELTALAVEHGNPDLQLTSRAGIQLRGLPDPLPTTLVGRIAAVGLLPSATHERVRNIVASPLTGVFGGLADLRGLVLDLDHALVAEPMLAELPSRFLFVVDDGRGDVTTGRFDLGYRALDAKTGMILVGDSGRGLPVLASQAVDALIDLARKFVQARRESGAWHVSELPAWIGGLPNVRLLERRLHQPEPPLGVVAGAASVQVPLAMLTPAQVAAVRRVAPGPVVITPWRGLVIPGGGPGLGVLTAAGLVADPTSPWSLVTACVGAPGCAKAAASTRTLAAELVAGGTLRTRTHVSGCERRCGAPTREHLDLVAARVDKVVG